MNDTAPTLHGRSYEPHTTDRRRSAQDLHNQGVLAVHTDKKHAYALVSSSVDVDPTFAQGWFQIGNFNGDLGLLHAACAAFRRVLEIEPDNVKALVNLGHRLYHLGKLAEARKATQRAIDLDPKLAFAWCNLSLIESVEGNLPKAVNCATRAFELDKDPIIETALAFALMYSRKLASGLKHFEARFPYKLPHFLQYPYPQWQGESLEGRRLFIQSEQGLGDTIRFSRFIPRVAAMGGSIVLAAHPELMRLFQMLLGDWRNITLVPLPCPFPEADFWTTMHSLPVALGLTDQEILEAPGLQVPAFSSPAPWKASDRKLHIGICWKGAAGNEIDKWRSVDVTQFLELYQCPGIQLYSLQVGQFANDLHMAGCASLIKDLGSYIRDVTDTIAVLRELDMVICVETALGHICGLIEKETWVAYGFHGGDFQIGRDEKGPFWYPSTRIFRQDARAQWHTVFKRIVWALREKVGKL